MLTLGQLVNAIQQLPTAFLTIEIRLVTEVSEADRGPFEGAVVMTSAEVAGLCVSKNGMYLFIQQEKQGQRQEPLPQVPPNFATGNKEIDERLREGGDDDPSEKWKKG